MISRTLSHYHIVEKLGAGGMGEVYKARDERLDRDVAIKVLRQDLASDPERLRRFEQEARAASALDHPNIITIHEIRLRRGYGGQVSVPESVNYIVMQYVEGKTLRELVSEGPLPTETLVRLATQIAEGLAKAHTAGIVHRDLKPENLMVTSDGYVKILDFGLAKLRTTPTEAGSEIATMAKEGTAPGAVMGTVGYMSPEQAKGQPVDFRSDQFSLGVILYEMATGTRAFQRESFVQTLSAIIEQEPDATGLVPTHLRTIVERCLAKSPEDRYGSTRDLARDIKDIEVSPSQPPAPQVKRRRVWPVIIGSLAAVFALLLILNVGGIRERLLDGASSKPIESIAVLPLENLSGDPEQEFFADGMTDALIADLAQIGSLKVISRTSVMRFKDTDRPLPDIAEELKVDGIVEGSVLRAGGRVRITAQLIHADTDQHLWAKSYERDSSDILTLQREVARAIADEIDIQLSPREADHLTQSRPIDAEAHEAYLKGRWFWSKWNESDLWKAVDYFNQAIVHDPNYAPPYAGLADSYVTLSFYSILPPDEMFPQAKAAVLKALELDESLAEAHVSLAFVKTSYDWDWVGAEKEYRRGIELNPGYATAHQLYAWYLVGMTRFDEALEEMKKAQEIAPLDVYTYRALGDMYLYARRYDEAIDAYESALEVNPTFTYTHGHLGLAYLQKSMYEEALGELQKELSLSGDLSPIFETWQGMVLAAMGRTEETRSILEELTELSEREYFPSSLIAWLYFALEEDDQGFAWLDRAYAERDVWLSMIQSYHAYDRVRDDSRFKDLLERMGLGSGVRS